MNNLNRFIILLNAFLILANPSLQHGIAKRSLLFPRATVLQFTYGLSVPLILRSRSINFSSCLQVNYDLPFNTTNFQTKVIQAKSTQQFDFSRQTFYKYLVNLIDSVGLNGEECLFRLICELSEVPLHLGHDESLLEEIAHFVFTPSLELSANGSTFSSNLIQAEKLGRVNGKCSKAFAACSLSLADLFTAKYLI